MLLGNKFFSGKIPVSFLFAIVFASGCGGERFIDTGQTFRPDQDSRTSPNIYLYSPKQNISNQSTITIRADHVTPNQTISIYDDATCEEDAKVAQKTPNASSVEFTLEHDADGLFEYYARIENETKTVLECTGPITYTFDTTPPKFVDVNDFGSSIALTTSESTQDIFIYDEFTCTNQVGQLIASSNPGNYDYVYAPTLPSNGVYAFYAQTTDLANNPSDCFGPLIYIYTNALPTLTVDPPTPLNISTGNISYSVTYTNTVSQNLTPADVTVNTTGTVVHSVNVLNGSTVNPTIQVIVTGGNGTVDGIDIADGTAYGIFDIVFGVSENTTVNVDNVAPTVSMSGPSVTALGTGDVDYDLTFAGADTINVTPADVTVNTTGSVTFNVSIIDSTTTTPVIRVNVTGGSGSIDGVVLAAGTSSDIAGNTDTGASDNTFVQVDTTPPTPTISISPTTPSPGDFNPPVIDIDVGTDVGGLTNVSLFRDDPTCTSTPVATGGHPSNTSISLSSDSITSGTGVYDYYVIAVDGGGNASACTGGASYDLTAPDAVSNLDFSGKGCDELTIGWVTPNENGTTIVNYQTRYKESSQPVSSYVFFDPDVSTDTQETVGPDAPFTLTPGTSYDFQMRTVTSNGAVSPWSNTFTSETLPNTPFFCGTFDYGAFNTGGATNSRVVAFEDGTTVEHYDSSDTLLNTYTLDSGETQSLVTSQFDYVLADLPVFIAGRRGSGGNVNKANMVWSPKDWAGNQFLFNGSRSPNHIVSVYAFEAADVDIVDGTGVIDTANLSTGGSTTFSLGNGSYEINSTGTIAVYIFSSSGNPQGGQFTDPQPLLPTSRDIIGYTGSINGAQFSSASDNNDVTHYHSNDFIETNTIDAGTPETINDQGAGTTSLYRSESVRTIADDPIVGRSNADSNGNCSAPHLPVTMMRKKYAINVYAEWVAFASLDPGVIEIIDPFDGSVAGTLNLIQNDGTPPTDNNTPYKAYIDRSALLGLVNSTTTSEGVIFRSDTRFAAWYEPQNDTDAANDDETILFGTDYFAPPTVEFASTSQISASEAGTMTITAQLNYAYDQTVTIPFTVDGASTALDPDDYSISASPLTINPGDTTAEITITIAPDTLDELDETVIVNLGAPTNATLGSSTTHTATIADDDVPPEVNFTSWGQVTVDETGSFVATAQLSNVSSFNVDIPFSLSGTANDPSDYTVTASPLSIPAGNTTADILITVVDNSLGEPAENVIITLGAPTNASLGTTDTFTLTITDNDATDIETTMTGITTANEGDTIAYDITVTNNGPQTATNLSINNSCPAGTTFSGSIASGSTSYTAPTWSVGTLNTSDSEVLTLSCTVNTGQGGNTITNNLLSADITLDQTNTVPANDGSSLSTTIGNNVDLSTSMSAPATQNEGADILYLITISNAGPTQAQNVELSNACPTGTTFNAAGTSASQGSYTAPTWSAGTINNGANATLSLACTVNAGQSTNTITNTIVSGDLSSSQTESNTANDGSSRSTTINNIADLATTKTAPANIIEGSDIVYTITLTNNGPAQAQSVTLTDSCPSGTTFNAGGTSASQGLYSAPTWTVGSVNSAANATLTLACTVDAGQAGNTITNTIVSGDLSMSQTDGNAGNDGDSASTLVQNETDLSLSISGPTTGEVGFDIVYSLTVTNLGPIAATSTEVTNSCPLGTTLNAGGTSATVGSYAPGTWTIGTLNNAASAELTLACTVDPGQEGTTITNTVTDADLTQDQADFTTANENDAVSSFIANSTAAGGGSFSGDEFWAVFGRNYDFGNGPCYIGDCIVTVQGDPGTNVTVDGTLTTIGASGQFTQVMSEANNVAPYSGVSTAPFEITSDGPINVFMGSALDQPTSAGTMLVPVTSLGQTYYALGYTNTVGAGTAVQAQIHVVATVDNTTVDINGNIQTIDEGESFSVSTPNGGFDITGQLITADQPVAVFVAETCLDTGPAACDMTMGQLHPADLSADTEFFFGGWSVQSEEFKCVATEDNADVTVNGVFDATYDQGDQINFAANSVLHVQSDEPLVCGVFALGSGGSDPAFTQVPGINRGMTRVEFPVPTPFLAGNVLVMMLTADTSTFEFDGATVGGWTTFPSDPSYSYTIINITAGPHSFVADSPFVPVMLVQPRTNAAYAASLGGLW